ncbi:hypothetical protein NUW54_g5551 [Trametes sanguinea]|uniref:Uncharacterized protein n=1 Tax=Trametes sanguinea TaxID=158606 RepID=A0ACC1PY65_9APHY|nr:hypothetical protein NUW54_g5551 [Trametes sanguinea]
MRADINIFGWLASTPCNTQSTINCKMKLKYLLGTSARESVSEVAWTISEHLYHSTSVNSTHLANMRGDSCVYDVPMALDPEKSRTDGLEPLLAWSRNRSHARRSRDYVLGPMHPISFVEEFLPLPSCSRDKLLSSRNAFAAVPRNVDTPSQIYEPLASSLNEKIDDKGRCPGHVFMKTVERSTRLDRLGHIKPHVCCFATENLDTVLRASQESRIEFGYAEMLIQVATSPLADYFVDPGPDLDVPDLIAHQFTRDFQDEESYDRAERTWGLHISYVTEVFARQQRIFLYTISLFGPFARLFRWDRSGCIVSESFDIHQHPDVITEFFWRFAHLSDAKPGHDLTYTMASPHEEALFRDTVRAYVALQLDVSDEELDNALKTHYQPGHVTKVPVHSPAAAGSGLKRYDLLVSRPIVSPLSLDGRCTRGFWAVDVETGKVVFLKDTWRIASHSETEGDILRRLNELGVRNVPILAFQGDVVDSRNNAFEGNEPIYQETRTNKYVAEPWAHRIDGKDVIVRRRRHYRLVASTVGYSIKTLRGTEELLHSTYDVFIAMKDALEKDSRIHRDLSVGNIILVKEPGRAIRRGYLIDWDASDRTDDAGESLHAGRAGTWSFLSIRMLSDGQVNGKHTFKDDMEALLYVVFYCGLLYLPHTLSGYDLTTLHDEFFERVINVKGVPAGGGLKLMNSINRLHSNQVGFQSAPFQEWLDTVMDYHSPPPALREKYKDIRTTWNGTTASHIASS